MNRSSKYGFYLPQNSDPISVSDFNYNFELIDDNMLTADDIEDYNTTRSVTVTSETVWTNVQRVTIYAPSVTGYKFVVWVGMETSGSAHVGYITTPSNAITYGYFPDVTDNLTVKATALYQKA